MNDRKYRQRGYQDGAAPSGGRDSGPGGGSSSFPSRLEGAPRGRGAERNRAEVFRCKSCGETNATEVALASSCRKCGAALHACNQCRHFDGGAQFQCRAKVPAPILAKSRANECALYEPLVSLDLTGPRAADTPDSARDAFNRLFGKK